MARVCVEGNIACGKSSALAALRVDAAVFPEPLHEWGELLGRFYEDPARWALAFSLRVLLSLRAPGRHGGPCVVERGPLAARHVFAQLLFNEGQLTQAEWELYKEYWDALAWRPDVVVYVHTPADECFRRMRERDRPEERHVDLQYLKRLEFQYDTMLRYADVPVVRVDGTAPPEDVAGAIADVVRRASSVTPAPA